MDSRETPRNGPETARGELIDHLRQKAHTEVHSVSFERNTVNGLWRASCPCGWFMVGREADVCARAATHDLEWIPIDPSEAQP